MDFKSLFPQLDRDSQQVLFAALWAGLDVHAPLDNLTENQWIKLEQMANFVNSELSK